MSRRVISLRVPQLATDRTLRRVVEGWPVALICREANADRFHDLTNKVAQGLAHRKGLADARATSPMQHTHPPAPEAVPG